MTKIFKDINERLEQAAREYGLTSLAWLAYAISLAAFCAVVTATVLHFVSMFW